jgi:DNA repair photolyase
VDYLAMLFEGADPTRECFYSAMDLDPRFRPGSVAPKTTVLARFREELSRRKAGSIIAITRNPDPYHPQAISNGFVRDVLFAIRDYGFGLVLETASDLVLQDIDILKEIDQTQRLMILVPIGFSQDIQARKIASEEPTFSQRIKLVHRLRQEGLSAGVVMKPIIPFVNDTEENMMSIVQKAKEAGALFVYPSFGILLQEEQRYVFYRLIDQEFPGLRNIYLDHYGLRKSWISPNVKALKKSVVFACKKAKISFGMTDIVKMIRPTQDIQLKLF